MQSLSYIEVGIEILLDIQGLVLGKVCLKKQTMNEAQDVQWWEPFIASKCNVERRTVEKINIYLIEYIAEVQKSNELTRETSFAYSFLWPWTCLLQISKWKIDNKKEAFHDPKSALYHVADNICKELQGSGRSSECRHGFTQEYIYAVVWLRTFASRCSTWYLREHGFKHWSVYIMDDEHAVWSERISGSAFQ